MEEKVVDFVRDTVDMTVKQTGYPVRAVDLTSTGIADRQRLRALEHRGHLQSMMIKLKNGTQYKAYYTEREFPSKLENTEKETSEG